MTDRRELILWHQLFILISFRRCMRRLYARLALLAHDYDYDYFILFIQKYNLGSKASEV